MKAYLDIIKKVLEEGETKHNRTGIDTLSVSGCMFEHDMKNGFPLITTKKVPFRLIASELEFFIKGITDKKWLQERKNHIWDEWCSPLKVPYSNDEDTKAKMLQERDLGPIYGWQWRHFGATYKSYDNYNGICIDQLKNVIKSLKTNPNDRRMIISAWNPLDLNKMGLPPCVYSYQVIVTNNKLNLIWNQRSVDCALGLPFDIAESALLLHLLAKESGFEEGKLIGFLGDTHIYKNHIKGIQEQLIRMPKKLPTINTENFTSIFDWNYKDSKIIDYNPDKRISFEIAV